MARSKLMSFSPNGEKLAHSGPDGIMRIWNTKSGILEHEYKPAEHLTATVSCLRYSPETKGKNKSSLIAMGTLAGTVLIYSPSKMDVLGILEHGSPHAILDVAWKNIHTLISLAADNTLVEWNVEKGDRRKTAKVKEGNSIWPVNDKMLMIGHRSIQSVSITEDSKVETIKSFTGHMSLISQLIPIQVKKGPPRYFLSSAQDDRYFYAWDMQREGPEAVGSFMVKQPISCVAAGIMSENSVVLSATTSKGTLVLFRQHLNGNVNKSAVKPIGNYRISCESNKKITIPILATYFNKESESIILVYGSSAVLKFENKKIKDLEGENEVVRQEPARVDSNETLKKTVTPKVSEKVTMVGPVPHLAPQNEKKRKHGDVDGAAALPMEERLSALVLSKSGRKGIEIPSSENVKQLILQSLHSKDQRLLNSVLTTSDRNLITKTVKYLPMPAVRPLLEVLQKFFMQGCKHTSYIIWVRTILYHHMSHLSTIPDREELMKPFLSACMSRLSTHTQITKLQARLDLMLNQVKIKDQKVEDTEPEPEALLIYNDDSSDDEDNLRKTGVSESEDQWEELSDYAGMNGHSDTDSEMEIDSDNMPKRKMGEEIVLDSDSDDGDDEAEENDSEVSEVSDGDDEDEDDEDMEPDEDESEEDSDDD